MTTPQIIIAGCGPVGLAAANCLARSPLISNILLIDSQPKPSSILPPPLTPHQRVYSINLNTINLLKSLGVWTKLSRHGQMENIQVVSAESKSYFHLNHNQACIVEAEQLNKVLWDGLQNYQHKIQFVNGTIDKIGNQSPLNIKIGLNSINYSTQLLIGSDGNRSSIKNYLKIPTYGWSYRQRAIVCTLQAKHLTKNKTGFQIYHNGNVLALLPLWNDYVSLVWSLGLANFQDLMLKTDQHFIQSLNNAIRQSTSNLQSLTSSYQPFPVITGISNKRLSFPLQSQQASNYTHQRVALIGDAAHSIHPMAGLGVNSGITDAILLTNQIIRNVRSGHDIGEHISLSQYESKAKMNNYANSFAIEAIKTAFEVNYPIINQLRGKVLNTLEMTPFLKQKIRQAAESNPIVSTNKYEWQ